jgi:Bifunctional DNA primase/polymerase, N-terminal
MVKENSSAIQVAANLAVALDYAQQWPIFPLAGISQPGICRCRLGAVCGRPGKHPLIESGFYGATRDEAIIRGWWSKWPEANIGIPTGRMSNLFVLDVDPRNGGSKSLAKLRGQFGELPETPTCQTGSGGWHYYFQYPRAMRIRGKRKDYPGLDFKGDGGYVVAPPSRHASGRVYQWLVDWRIVPLAPVPDWLLELIRKDEAPKGRSRGSEKRKSHTPAIGVVQLGPEDWEIINRLENGDEGEKYRLLFEGDWESLGYASQSEADLALFNKLARLTNGDGERMYAIFSKTGLIRQGEPQ